MTETLSIPADALDTEAVMRLLPHRYPMLMIDRLSIVKPYESAVGWKAVTINEPHFMGHFPQYPVMPGVLIVEALAQAAGALIVHSLGPKAEGRLVYFMTIDKARFRRPVRPGDILRMPVNVLRSRGPVWKFSGEAFVGSELCAEAEYSAMLGEDMSAQAAGASQSDG